MPRLGRGCRLQFSQAIRYPNVICAHATARPRLHDGPDGVWAPRRAGQLPGLVWANLFGTPDIDLIGRDRLTSAPAQTRIVGKNVLVTVHSQPEEWALASAGTRNDDLAGHIGAHHFFDRDAPNRPTAAPDFGLLPLHARRPFQVFTTNGDPFTPLP